MTYVLHDNIIVATDLDGTLLDHYTYSWKAALPALDRLKQRGIPVVINTSKTYAEAKHLQKALDIEAAFIVENGSAIYIDVNSIYADTFQDYDQEFNRNVLGIDRQQIVDVLHDLRKKFDFSFESYTDWDIEDIIKHTGLTEKNAQASSERQFSEPLIWSDTDEKYARFKMCIEDKGLRIIQGGRFTHILGTSDKGKALVKLKTIFFNEAPCSLVCLGDGPNDLDMLNIADTPIFVRSPTHDFPPHACVHTPFFTEGLGPVGWNEAILKIFN